MLIIDSVVITHLKLILGYVYTLIGSQWRVAVEVKRSTSLLVGVCVNTHQKQSTVPKILPLTIHN
jgi:hypothetical protein